jgi:hypothetical protein
VKVARRGRISRGCAEAGATVCLLGLLLWKSGKYIDRWRRRCRRGRVNSQAMSRNLVTVNSRRHRNDDNDQ